MMHFNTIWLPTGAPNNWVSAFTSGATKQHPKSVQLHFQFLSTANYWLNFDWLFLFLNRINQERSMNSIDNTRRLIGYSVLVAKGLTGGVTSQVTWLTFDVERDAFADGRRYVIGGDAHVSAHHLPRHAVKTQLLALVRIHICHPENPIRYLRPFFLFRLLTL